MLGRMIKAMLVYLFIRKRKRTRAREREREREQKGNYSIVLDHLKGASISIPLILRKMKVKYTPLISVVSS